MKNEKGITLIALVITIIVLLILAGVSIAMISDENGILGRATGAAKTSRIAEDKEAAIMDLNAAYTAYMEQKYVNNVEESTTTTFLDFLDSNVDKYLKTDSDHYTYSKNSDHKITTKHENASNKKEEATVQNNGGIGEWSEVTE